MPKARLARRKRRLIALQVGMFVIAVGVLLAAIRYLPAH